MRAHRPHVILVKPRRSRAAATLAALAGAALLAGCQTLETYMPAIEQFGVYRIDINQGNFLSQDMVDRLQVGMSKQQVRATLGTPLITTLFRDNRWDYVYQFTRQGRVREHRQFTVYFADDKLSRWEGDEMPQSVVELNRLASQKVLKRQPDADDQGFFSKIIDWIKSN